MKIAACGVLLLLLAACGPLDDNSTGPSSGSSHVAKMPNLVGKNLQEAQDQIQDLVNDPVYLTTSHDASGQDRQQVRDKDWKVCTQNVKEGAEIGMKSQIDFGAVKNEEQCP
jgi:beta-lactam-binding protein with PASTA domain